MGETFGPVASHFGLENHGLTSLGEERWNLPPAELYQRAIADREGEIAPGGAFLVLTGEHTGRAPKDKFIVDDALTRETVAWGGPNTPMSPEQFDALHTRIADHLKGKPVYVRDMYAGADPDYRLKVRVVTETAWHNMFVDNMFIEPGADQRAEFEPDFTVIHAPRFQSDPERDGTNSNVFILVNFTKRIILVGGTWYAGEIKKGIFGVLNFLLPDRGVMPMHCSANIGLAGDTAIFFGLSGTGKTTLSADGSRTLIGDDEHGWSARGVFNFEGGCYAKVIKLSPTAEPEIFETTSRFGTILENVAMDPVTRAIDLDDGRYTENTRASYPLNFIPNVAEDGLGGHPKNVVMLTADAFGVLPPISKLTPEQAMYHFLSGYTARVAGTERGVTEPQATFSTCFGAPFMPRHPSVYARLLGDLIERHGATCWLVNTGWSGGRAGEGGERMAIAHTRAMVNAALDGGLAASPVAQDGNFGLLVPQECPNVPAGVLMPRNTWSEKTSYDSTAAELRKRFENNFEQFEKHVDDNVRKAAIRAAA